MLANGHHLAIDVGLACQADERGLQRLGSDQPDGQTLGFQAAQYRAGENEGNGLGEVIDSSVAMAACSRASPPLHRSV